MKSKYAEQLDRLNARLAVREQDQDVHGLLDAGIDKKREVIGSMYPEKLTFDRERLRTTRINEAARMLYTLDKAFSENEKGQSGNIPTLSSQVGKTGRTVQRHAAGIQYFNIIGSLDSPYSSHAPIFIKNFIAFVPAIGIKFYLKLLIIMKLSGETL